MAQPAGRLVEWGLGKRAYSGPQITRLIRMTSGSEELRGLELPFNHPASGLGLLVRTAWGVYKPTVIICCFMIVPFVFKLGAKKRRGTHLSSLRP
ncbi:hypothetical protein C7T94_02320 [Pedobacter yulinensis]|uniref:Uncharacterized protein n=1 Tax=Pedobacter yulinensis TaxID=2126353 RepID=A0A2T3HRD4_9SPHI|nr:hypothetical protein C7T94_02320 [Pedobacter yulinensis]